MLGFTTKIQVVFRSNFGNCLVCHKMKWKNAFSEWKDVIDLFLGNNHDDSKQFKDQIERRIDRLHKFLVLQSHYT